MVHVCNRASFASSTLILPTNTTPLQRRKAGGNVRKGHGVSSGVFPVTDQTLIACDNKGRPSWVLLGRHSRIFGSVPSDPLLPSQLASAPLYALTLHGLALQPSDRCAA